MRNLQLVYRLMSHKINNQNGAGPPSRVEKIIIIRFTHCDFSLNFNFTKNNAKILRTPIWINFYINKTRS